MWKKAMLSVVCVVLSVGGLARAEVPNQSAAMIVSSTELTLGFDRAMHDRLVSLGFDVRVVPDSEVTGDVFRIADADTYALLLISESIGSARADKLIGTKTPVMHNESYGWDNWRFTIPTNMHWATGTSVDIVSTSHPIATMAGVKIGSMAFFSTGASWTTESVSALAPGAELIAQINDAGTPCAIVFAIEEGAQLANGSAALARSVGFSIPGNNSYDAGAMTDEAWALFDATIRWLTRSALPTLAMAPSPADTATDVLINVVLSWGPGESADTHDVYFGTSFDDVNDGVALVSPGQDVNSYDPGLLEYGQTYYWRVDEVDAPPNLTVYQGAVWSFTTEPYAYPIAGVTATASGAEVDMGPENTVNGSGLDDQDQHSTEGTEMWLSSGSQPAWIQFELPEAEKLHEMWVWNSNQLVEAFIGFGAKDVSVEYSLDGETWTALEGVPEFGQANGTPTYTADTTIGFGGVLAKYVKLTVHDNWGGVTPQAGLSEVRFFAVPLQARAPIPADGATGVALDAEFNWRPGREATSHTVYLGTDQAAVAEGTAPAVTVTEPSYVPALLALDTTYFWKIDEVGTDGTRAGNVWSFSTTPYVIVDDFESYNDQENAGTRIYETWVDGYGTTTNGSQVGNLQAPFAEKTMIHGGTQSMPLFYDNSGGKTSEAIRTFEAAQDWTAGGIKSLSLWFYGAPDNAGQLYVKINNTKLVYDGGAADLKAAQWQPWNIDLTTVSGANKVTKLTIGVEGAAVTGTVYIDDIRLYPKTPDLLIPVEPAKMGLLAEYLFDNGANDTSGQDHHGTFLGDARVADSRLVLDGTDDAVFIPRLGGAAATHAQCTYSMWIYSLTKPEVSGFIGGINYDNWGEGGGIHCKLYNGWANVGVSGVPGGDLNGTTIVDSDEWMHLGLTVTTVTLYLNGQIEASRSFTTPVAMILGRGCIGAYRENNDIQRELKGQMDDVRIYNRAVSLAKNAVAGWPAVESRRTSRSEMAL